MRITCYYWRTIADPCVCLSSAVVFRLRSVCGTGSAPDESRRRMLWRQVGAERTQTVEERDEPTAGRHHASVRLACLITKPLTRLTQWIIYDAKLQFTRKQLYSTARLWLSFPDRSQHAPPRPSSAAALEWALAASQPMPTGKYSLSQSVFSTLTCIIHLLWMVSLISLSSPLFQRLKSVLFRQIGKAAVSRHNANMLIHQWRRNAYS